MKENEQTTINHLSTLSRAITLKAANNTDNKGEDEIKTNNALQKLNSIVKPSLTKDLKRSKTKQIQRTLSKRPTIIIMKNINLNEYNQQKREEKFNLEQLGRIEYAKQHSSANRPLNKLVKDFKDNQIFCRCCGLPCITPGVIEPFKICDNTDKYSILGQAISLYFSFYKFSIFILFILLCSLIMPSFYITHLYYSSISYMCNNILIKNSRNDFSKCENYITNKEYLNINNKESKVSFQSQFNAANVISYINLYNDIMNNRSNSDGKQNFKNIVDKTVINNSIIYFVVLICLFIINLLYIIFQNNKILDYNFHLISPSDYAVIMTNLFNVFKSFRKMKDRFMKNNKIISSQKVYRRKLGFSENELNNKNITVAMEFCEYIKIL